MIIKVDKRCTFGIRNIEKSSIQYLPKLLVNNEVVPAIKDNENFIYLGRSFSFKMDNNYNKLELVSNTKEFLERSVAYHSIPETNSCCITTMFFPN